jgi:hypothetical protein
MMKNEKYLCLICDSIVPTYEENTCECGALSVYHEPKGVRIIGDALMYVVIAEDKT